MFYAYIPLFPYMGANLGQMLAAAALRLLRLRLEIPAADRGTPQSVFQTVYMAKYKQSNKHKQNKCLQNDKLFFC